MISIIIPFYNEEKVLLEKSHFFEHLSNQAELIFVDGGSTDRSVQIVRNYGRVVQGRRGRAAQMNYGASLAQYGILLFLHADNFIETATLVNIEEKLVNGGFVGGCLTQRIDKHAMIYRLIEGQGNRRARNRKIFYGDQGIFVKKDIFLAIGGYPDVPIMEDVLFSKQLKKAGEVAILADEIFVSPRRWEKRGIARTVLLYNFLIILFHLRVPLNKIKKFYDDLR